MEKFPRKPAIFIALILITATVTILSNFIIPHENNYQVQVSNNQNLHENLRCGKFPSDVILENNNWQILNTTNGTFKIYNAYYDNRSEFKEQPVIRIYALFNRINPKIQTYCQIWFKDLNEPVVVRPFEYKLTWPSYWRQNQIGSSPYLIGCRNPRVTEVPSSVSLVENACDEAVNNLQVLYNLPASGRKKGFAVCVKDLYFDDDVSMKIMEWIEIVSLLGADKIFIYVVKLHPNIMNLLKYYETQGKVKIEMMSRPNGIPRRNESLIQKYHNELISLNDCLYKNMYEYNYVIPLDTDEIIMLENNVDNSWSDLAARYEVKALQKRNKPYAAYSAKTAFFFSDNVHKEELQPEIPSNLHFLHQVYRSTNDKRSEIGVKSFQNTEMLYAVHHHFPMECIEVHQCDALFFETEDARLHHYRDFCSRVTYSENECNDFRTNTTKDLSLWRFKDELLANIKKTLNDIQAFLPS